MHDNLPDCFARVLAEVSAILFPDAMALCAQSEGRRPEEPAMHSRAALEAYLHGARKADLPIARHRAA